MIVQAAVDPGVKKSGFAVGHDRFLVVAGTAKARDHHEMARELADILVAYEVDEVVIEKMRKYRTRSETHKDLDRVEAMVRALTKLLRARGIRVTRCYPADWKGQVPKEVCRRRLEKMLSPAEQAAFLDPGHDAWDAAGILVVCAGRAKRGLV